MLLLYALFRCCTGTSHHTRVQYLTSTYDTFTSLLQAVVVSYSTLELQQYIGFQADFLDSGESASAERCASMEISRPDLSKDALSVLCVPLVVELEFSSQVTSGGSKYLRYLCTSM